MDALLKDIKYSLKLLFTKPAFSAVAILTLALGIGINSTVFSIVNGILLRPLAYASPDRLMVIWASNPQEGYTEDIQSYPNLVDFVAQSQSFESIGGYAFLSFNITDTAEPERVIGGVASSNFFSLLGVKPLVGRTFLPEEDWEGHNQVVLLSHGFWERRYGSNPGIIDQPITVNQKVMTVVGILPQDFRAPDLNQAEVWAPLTFASSYIASRSLHYLTMVGRLRPGTTQAQAQLDMSAVAQRLEQQFPDANRGWGIRLAPLQSKVVGKVRLSLLVLLVAVSFILIIACANVANLLLVRADGRKREMAIRSAMGADITRLVRQLLTESLVLAVLSGAISLLFSDWAIKLLLSLKPANIPRLNEIKLDWQTFGFTLAVSVVTGIAFGLLPARQSLRLDLNGLLKEGGKGASTGRKSRRLRSLVVVSEVALSMAVVIGAGLMVRSFFRLQDVNPGFEPKGLLSMRVTLPPTRYPEYWDQAAFYKKVLDRVSTLPRVASAAAVTTAPLTGSPSAWSLTVVGKPPASSEEALIPFWNAVSPSYFRTMGIRLLAGREFSDLDTNETAKVVIISDTMARRLFPGENPLGKQLIIGYGDPVPRQIVGLVADVKAASMEEEPNLSLYTPYPQLCSANMYFIIRGAADVSGLAPAVRAEIAAVDRDQPVYLVRTMNEVVQRSVSEKRFIATIFTLFAAVAIVLATVGIYSVVAYSAAQRTHEMGIRMALGAQRADVVRLVVKESMLLGVAGVCLGLGFALSMTHLLSSLVFKVSVADPLTLLTVSLLFIAIAFLASYWPANKATRVDPVSSLRYD
jgi:putative ABC transport system permease protein